MIHVFGGADYPAYVIDDETLREELLSEEDTREWLAESPGNPDAVSFWRMLGELDRALEAGREVLLGREPGSAPWAAAAVRLATVHHWRKEYAQAHDLLDAAEEVFAAGMPEHEPMLAFVHQHRAKALFDEGRTADAATAARAALALREGRAAAPLVASTRQTLARIERDLTATEQAR